jgi:transcriptional regulator with XRE-family HTH domain
VTRLQLELLRLGVSQRELAERASVAESSLSRICNGKEPAYPKRGKRIAEALGWAGDPEDLFQEVTSE